MNYRNNFKSSRSKLNTELCCRDIFYLSAIQQSKIDYNELYDFNHENLLFGIIFPKQKPPKLICLATYDRSAESKCINQK